MLKVSILELTGCYVTGGITATIKVTARMRYVMRYAIISAVGPVNTAVCLGKEVLCSGR